MASEEGTTGRTRFIEHHGLWSRDQKEAAKAALERLEADSLEAVRFSFCDQHGILRGKTILAAEVPGVMSNGCAMVSTLLAKDIAHRTVYPVFTKGGGFGMAEMSGAGDIVMVPDPLTFRVLPWQPDTGWMQCDIYFTNGRPVPFSTRAIATKALAELERCGYGYTSGLEVEFHLFRLDDARLEPAQSGWPGEPPEVSFLTHGYQYLTETRMDELEPATEILRRNLTELGLPLRSIEVELGPGQLEVTFAPGHGLDSADWMVLFRSAAKQICRRYGMLASFMCRPAIANTFSSGWHLHQSLADAKTGARVFMPEGDGEAISPLGRHFAGGLIAHAGAASIFATPTINGYKRFKPYSLAPDRANWGRDNRGTMIRVVGGPGDPGTRLENRLGEPAANPYLYVASQIICGLDGIANERDPGPFVDEPYEAAAPALPGSLMQAVDALQTDSLFREHMGAEFVDYLIALKRAEIEHFLGEVTDWEHREYFENL